MQNLTFKSRLSFLFSTTLALSLVLTGLIFSLAYYGINLFTVEKFMIREASEIVEKHLINKDKEIFFRKDDMGRSLSAYLRDESLSAIVADRDSQVIATYGVYRGILDADPQARLIKKENLDLLFKSGLPKFTIDKIYGDRSYLELTQPLLDETGNFGFLILSTDINLGNQTLIFSLMLLGFIIPISFILGWIFTTWLVERSFEPLEEILFHMRRVEISNLSERIEVKGNPADELARLSESFNEMLGRIDEGVRKQKEFISNASHELKTPLAQAVLALDIAEMKIKSGSSKEALNTIGKTRKDLKGFGDLIHSLLTLANIDRSNVLPTDISVETREIIDGLQAMAAEKNKEIILRVDTHLGKFLVQSEHWKVIVINLITNAIKYSNPKGKIVVSVGVSKKRGYLLVENSGEKMSKLDISRIIKRFYRTRKKGEPGHGIGLSIVSDIVSHYHLDMKIDTDNHNLFRIYIHGFDLYN